MEGLTVVVWLGISFP